MTVSTDEDDENSKKLSHKSLDYWVVKEQGNSGNAKEQGSNNDNKGNGKNYRAGDDGDGCLVMRSRQSMDKWTARRAREMMSNIDKQSQEAELMASSASASSSSSSASNPTKESLRNIQNPQAESDSGAAGNRGASLLVQMWEKRLNRSNSLNSSMSPVSISSRTSSGISNNDSEASRESEMGDSVHERDGVRSNNEDSHAEWGPQSGKTAQSDRPTRRNSDAVESERVRISDIIKRLSSASVDTNDHDAGTSHCESPSRERRNSPVTDQAEKREKIIYSRVICSPKIRGRQAFTDLLMQLERERHRELDSLGQRQAVSRFTNRGRIQAMLRLRFLHCGIAIRDQLSSQSVGSRSCNQLSHMSEIRHLREKFSPGAEHGATAQNATTLRNPHLEMDNNAVHLEGSSAASGLREDNHLQEASTGRRKSTGLKEKSESQTIEYHQKEGGLKIDVTRKGISMETTSDHQKEASPKDDATPKGTVTETTFLDLQGTAETSTFLNGRKGKSSEIAEDHERKQEQHIHGKSQEKSLPTALLGGQNANEWADEQEANEQQQQLCIDSQENAETTASLNDWDENELAEEEEEAYFQDQFLETNYDWISEISRPRSYWEDRRQTWYQEMLNSSPGKEEIRQLLERRRVSTFLTSDFRQTMDRMMTSHVERQMELEAYQEEEEEEMSQERMRHLLLAHLQRHVHSAASQEGEQAEERGLVEQVNEPIVEEEEEQEPEQQQEDEEQEEEEDEEEEEEENPTSPLFHEASDFDQSSPSVQLISPSTIHTWSYQDVGDESDPVRSRSSPQPLPSQAYYQDSWQSTSSTNRISIERELIYDLRGQIKRLHREMSELRKSVHSCMEIKVKLHQYNQQEVHPVKGMEGNNSLDGALKKRSCCICYEMQVDSLLYRCGHMCTCLQCAHELQWSSGKCPICRAPIDDVVQAFMDS